MKSKMVKFTDSKLSIKKPAFDVLKLLSGMKVDVNENEPLMSTAAWYNGRERGIQLNIKLLKPGTKGLVIVWSECRGSDQIVVYRWLQDLFLNPASVCDMNDATYRAGKYFDPDEQEVVAKYIRSAVQSYLDGRGLL